MSSQAHPPSPEYPPLRNYSRDNDRMLRILAKRTPSPLPQSNSESNDLNDEPSDFFPPWSTVPSITALDVIPAKPFIFHDASRPNQTNLFIPFPIHSGLELVGVYISTADLSAFDSTDDLSQTSSTNSSSKSQRKVMLQYKMPQLRRHSIYNVDTGIMRYVFESRIDEIPLPKPLLKELEAEGWNIAKVEFVKCADSVAFAYRDAVARKTGVPGVGWPGIKFRKDVGEGGGKGKVGLVGRYAGLFL